MRIFSSERTTAGLGTNRMEAFSDGVFAIAITLLVLNLHVPLSDAKNLLRDVLGQWPSLVSYALSVMIIGIYWVAHHNTFHYIKRANRPFLWINILLLMCVAFIPFPAALLGQYPFEQTSVVIYAGSLIVTNLFLSLLWWYATSNHRLVDTDIDPHFVRMVHRKNLTSPVVYLIAIAISFLSIKLSLILFILFPLYYILPGHIDLHLTPTSRREGEASKDKAHQHQHTAEPAGHEEPVS